MEVKQDQSIVLACSPVHRYICDKIAIEVGRCFTETHVAEADTLRVPEYLELVSG